MKKGFTLIEVLVVISIIAILSGIILASFGSSRVRARDAKRVSDIGQLQLSLESYFKDDTNKVSGQFVYPQPAANNTIPSSLAPTYIGVLPTDPKDSTSYSYYRNTDNQSYCVGANLENASSPSITGNTSCTGISWCTLSTNYKVCRY